MLVSNPVKDLLAILRTHLVMIRIRRGNIDAYVAVRHLVEKLCLFRDGLLLEHYFQTEFIDCVFVWVGLRDKHSEITDHYVVTSCLTVGMRYWVVLIESTRRCLCLARLQRVAALLLCSYQRCKLK